MGESIRHWNVISSVKSNNLTPWYETVDNNEVINFVSDDGLQRHVNSITIWTENDALYIQVSDFGDGQCVYIPANSFLSLDYLFLEKMKVLANAGVKIRYLAMYY